MYGYQKDIPSRDLTAIFDSISQESVFKHVFGEFRTNHYIISPFRPDSSPRCWITWKEGKLYFCDFSQSKPSLDMIGIIQAYYNIGFHDAIDFILEENWEPKSDKEVEKSTVKSKTPSSIIEFVPKSFDSYQKKYWSQYEITSSQLIEDNIFPTAWFKIYSSTYDKWITISPHAQETTYAISFEDSVKICRPNVRDKAYKWISNVSKNTIGGVDLLPYLGDTLVITKSYKDWRVLTNMGLTCVWFQNEGMIPDWDVLNRLMMFKDIVVWFDNDKAGIEASSKLVSLINKHYPSKARGITLPTIEKDPADVMKAGKKQFLLNFINKLL